MMLPELLQCEKCKGYFTAQEMPWGLCSKCWDELPQYDICGDYAKLKGRL